MATAPMFNELDFREKAGLCIRCGKARREEESDLCGNCEYNDQTNRTEDFIRMQHRAAERERKLMKIPPGSQPAAKRPLRFSVIAREELDQ
jgi:hypothetical protein